MRTPSSRRLRAGLAAALLGSAVTAQLATASAAPGTAPTFSAPVVAIPGEVQQTEPQLLVDPDGTVLVGSQFQRSDCATGAPRLAGSRACVWRSDDGGRSFARSGGGQNTGADVEFVRLASGTLLYTTLAQPEPGTFTSGVGGATVLRSTDRGRTWTSTILNGLSPALDRPFLTALDDATVLLTYTAFPGNLFVSRSTDDGVTFGPGLPITAVPQQLEFTRPGGPAVDPARGEFLQPYFAGTSDDPALNQSSQSGMLDIGLARSADGGVTWTQEVVATRVRPVLGIHAVAADARGREFLVWSARDESGQVDAWISRNLGPGQPWSQPVALGVPAHSGTLAWVVARGDGGVAVGYLGSDHPDARTVSRPWTVRVAVSQDAGDTWTVQNASGHVVYTGPQSGSLSLTYDMLGLVVDDDGFLHLAYPRRVTVDGVDLTQVEYVQQTSGRPLGGRGRPARAG